MADENDFKVHDAPLLAGQTVKNRLLALQRIDEADAQAKIYNKHTARERLELLKVLLEIHRANMRIAGTKS